MTSDMIKNSPLLGPAARFLYKKFCLMMPGNAYWAYERRRRMVKKAGEFISKALAKDIGLEFRGDGAPVVTLPNGLKFAWDLDRSGSLLAFPFNGPLEPECMSVISRVIKPGSIIIDVGANFGWYSCHFAALTGASGKVFSFEPTSVVRELRANLALNGLDHIVTVENMALDAREGTGSIYVPLSLGTAYSSLRKHKTYAGEKYEELRTPLTTIDAYISGRKAGKVDFIKVDAEGAELPILRGGEECLRESSPAVLLELFAPHTECFGYVPQDCVTFLQNLGYTLYEITGTEPDHLKKIHSFNETEGYNFLAIKG